MVMSTVTHSELIVYKINSLLEQRDEITKQISRLKREFLERYPEYENVIFQDIRLRGL